MLYDLVEEICCSCGIKFAMAKELHAQRVKDHKMFSCPNGHEQYYRGKTKDQKRVEELEKEKTRLESLIERAERALVQKNREYQYRCPMAHCSFGTQVKLRMREHLSGKHRFSIKPPELPADAGKDAHGDMGIN